MNSVAYAIETLYVEQNDFAQLAVRKLIGSDSGLLLAGSDEESVFAIVNLTGAPPQVFNTDNPITSFGFVMPSYRDVEALRQDSADVQKHLLCAGNYAELTDQMLVALNWAFRRIRSLEHCQVAGVAFGDPNPDPVAAKLVLELCERWTSDEPAINVDEALSKLLGD